jgi:uncharacterized membrane protein
LTLFDILGVSFSALFLLVGSIWRYLFKHFAFNAGYFVFLILGSLISGFGLVYMLKAFDYYFLNSLWLNSGPSDIKWLALVGAIIGIFATCYFFQKFLSQDKHTMRKQKRGHKGHHV